MIYYSKRIQSKVSKGERHTGQNLEEMRLQPPESSLIGFTQNTIPLAIGSNNT